MKYKTLFRLALRFFGIIVIVLAAVTFVGGIVQAAFFLGAGGGVAELWNFSLTQLIVPFFEAAIGLYLFRRGDWIVDLAIPSNRPYCPECAYDLTGSASDRCPECGTPFRRDDVHAPTNA